MDDAQIFFVIELHGLTHPALQQPLLRELAQTTLSSICLCDRQIERIVSQMRLFLCEKPSQARDIGRVLGATKRGDGCLVGSNATVTWAIGHLLEAAPPDAYDVSWGAWRLETLPILPEYWKFHVKQAKAKQFKVVEQLLKQTNEVIIATDADREGEMIARELLTYCDYRGSVKRLWLSALNDASILKALREMKEGTATEPLYASALARAQADWLFGMNLTRLFTLLAQKEGFGGVLSVGRVQTPTLKLVVDRDREINAFVATPYWTVQARLAKMETPFIASWLPPEDAVDDQGRCCNRQRAESGRNMLLRQRQVCVMSVTTKRVKEAPPLPFELSQLQSECSAKLGLGAQETLDVVQALYETHKAVTYPRTDCPYLPVNMFAASEGIVKALVAADSSLAVMVAGLDLKRRSRAWDDAKVTVSAHHAIVPTDAGVDLGRMSEKERTVYDLICRRFLAQFAEAHEYDKTEAMFSCQGETLKATGRKLLNPGWMQILKVGEGESDKSWQALPELVEGEFCEVEEIKLEEKLTTPPPHYTEGTLVEAMKNIAKNVKDERLRATLKETAGVGTNATRGAIIKGLLDRQYLMKRKGSLLASDNACALIDAVPDVVADPGTTAVWEQALEMIADGKLSLEEFVAKQRSWIVQTVAQYQTTALAIKAPEAPPCPLCGALMRLRKGAKTQFWGCVKYPDCRGIVFIEGNNKKGCKKPLYKRSA